MANYDTVRAWRKARSAGRIRGRYSAGVARFAEFIESTMPDVVLIGVSGWESLVAEGAMPGVYGVLFADSFFAGSTRPATRDFVARFETQYGSPPGALEAEGFDAATLARAALEAGARSRGAFIRAVRAVPGDRTASGAYHITAAGVDRSLFVLQVSDGMVREVSGAASPAAEVDLGYARTRSEPDRARPSAATEPPGRGSKRRVHVPTAEHRRHRRISVPGRSFGCPVAAVLVGQRQDCAVLRVGARSVVLTVDALIEDVRFGRGGCRRASSGQNSGQCIGVAAMGARPRFAGERRRAAYPARDLAACRRVSWRRREVGAYVVSGNLAPTGIRVDVGGGCADAGGDATGRRGRRSRRDRHARGRGARVPCAVRCGSRTAVRRYHDRNRACRQDGCWSARCGVTMIDVSDGLVQDLRHICEQSGSVRSSGHRRAIARLPVADG
jgi:hypothetical protein